MNVGGLNAWRHSRLQSEGLEALRLRAWRLRNKFKVLNFKIKVLRLGSLETCKHEGLEAVPHTV